MIFRNSVCRVFKYLFSVLLILNIISIYAADNEVDLSELNNVRISLTPEEEKWLDNHRKVSISGPFHFPPFHFYTEEGKASGIAADYIGYITSSLGLEVESYEKLPWPEVLKRARNRKIDIIACSARSPEREEYLSFSDSYLSFPLVIVSRDDSRFIGGLQDLYDLKVALVKGVVVHDWLKEDKIEVNPYFTESPLESLEAVSSGQADAYIGNLAAVSYLINKNGLSNLKVASPTKYKNYELFISVRSDWPELISIINKWLAAVTPQQHSAVRNDWLSIRYEYGLSYADVFRYILLSSLFFCIILIVIFIWNRKLKREIEFRKKAEHEKEDVIIELKEALNNIDILGGLLPICSHCRKIRDDKGYWKQLDSYLEKKSNLSFSHGLCPECEKNLYGKEKWYNEES